MFADGRQARGAWRWIVHCAIAVTVAVLVLSAPRIAGAAGEENAGSDSAASVESEYKLGALDKIRVMVFEWRPSRDEIFAWSALNAEYSIGPSGKLALPLVGEILAAGRSTGELAAAIGEQLKSRMGLASAPDTAVEVVKFRPFYVAGHVEKPGEYPFRPGLTVLQAVSISGGLIRKADAGLIRLERDSVATRGELDLLDRERDTLLARKARLEAEFNRADEITFPPELLARSGDTDVATAHLLEQETLVFKAHKVAFDTQSKALQQLKGYLEKEVVSVTGQMAAHKRQIEALDTELAGVRALQRKGLATAPRKLALDRNLAQLEGDGMRLNGGLMKIRQEISKTEISMLELENKRSGDVATELQQTQIKLEQVVKKLDTARQLLYEAEVIAPSRVAEYGRGRKVVAQMRIVRMEAGQAVEIVVGETTNMRPGDTLKVEIPSRVADDREPGASGAGPVSLPPPHAPKRAALEKLKGRFGD